MRRVLNAAAAQTKLGGSLMPEPVLAAISRSRPISGENGLGRLEVAGRSTSTMNPSAVEASVRCVHA